MTEQKLKKRLSELKEKKFKLETKDEANELIRPMFEFIGSTDPELRDHLIYVAFYSFIAKYRYFSKETMKSHLKTALDNDHLFCGLGEKGTDTVFIRTFSALVVALLVWAHNEDHYLSKEEVINVKNKCVDYYSKERDHRGFVPEKGWAHSAAHGADMFEELANCGELDAEDIKDILNCIKNKIVEGEYAFIDLEDERMVTPIINLLKREDVDNSLLINWIKGFENVEYDNEFPTVLRISHNVCGLLKGLYFRIIFNRLDESLLPVIQEAYYHNTRFKDR
ncbi:MAG TPA: DUF2785 domain-containing protein [Thermotogota bacterium]|nr:DUF2785 domain-containing protein [Thermotogota bacterium]HPJ90132.1 DUF2785 domain-containing protein [Thermotogota bacterium]